MLYVSSSKRFRIGLAFQKLSSKHLIFHIKYQVYQMITIFSNELRINIILWEIFCRIFSQDIFYKLNFSKSIANLLRIKFGFYLILAFSQFLLHLLSTKWIQFEQILLENWILDRKMYRFNERSIIRSWINTIKPLLKSFKRFSQAHKCIMLF